MTTSIHSGAPRHKVVSPENILNKSLPTSIEAEKAVLSALILDNQNLGQVADILKPQDFYSKSHQSLYQAFLELSQTNKKLDLLLLQDHLDAKKQLDEVGGLEYLMELAQDIPA